MARIRTVKPELFRHEDLFEAEQQCQLPLRLAFIGLFTCCDRAGRFRWRPRQLMLDILPYDSIDMADVLNALAGYGFIIKYEQDGQYYGCIPSWGKHQCVNHKEKDSEYPALEHCAVIDVTLSHQNDKSTSTETPVKHASATGDSRVRHPW